ncbi:MAG: tyrosine--tRNA ligase [Parcubacteria group bacterium]|nr:tyrosine--tRNA ligase [Parcubacteria group bacterium]
MNVLTDEKKIDEALERSVANILPSKEALKKILLTGKRLRFYIGADPTGPDLHLGHATNFILLERMRKLGHEIIVLFGDFTARIGDPTDKDAARKALTEEEIEENIKTWKKQVGKVLHLDDKENPAVIKKNSVWLSKLSPEEILKLAAHVTVQRMIERDMFERRLIAHKPIYLHEFFYPLLQGYDSVAMDVDVEVGGTDQTFNMLVGRDLQKTYNNKEKFVITTPLLEDPRTGKKLMSKSEGGYVALNDAPQDMYGKVMALPDEVVVSVLEHSTLASISNVRKMEKDFSHPENRRDLKMLLAREVVKTYHGEKDAIEAEAFFVATFQKKDTPREAPQTTASSGELLVDVLLREGTVASKTEFRRLVKEGAVTDLDQAHLIEDEKHVITKPTTFKIGKRRFLRVLL